MKFILGSAISTVNVPRLNPEGNVGMAPIQNPRATGLSPEAFGAGIGKGLGEVASGMNKLATEEIDKANRTRAIESRTALDQAEVDLLYDEKSGALQKRGKDAFSLEEPTLKAFDDRVGEITSGLSTDTQKETFRLLAMQRRVEVDKQIQRHVNGELRSYADETNKASLESTRQNIVRNFADPARVEQERNFGLAVIASEAKEKGLPPQVVKAKVDGWDSLIHTSIIERLLVDDPIGAKNYFDKVQGVSADFRNPSGLVAKGNIDLSARPQVKNADGSISTVRSMGVNIDGKEVLIPTVSEDGRILSNKEAVRQYQETGKHLGIFKTPEDSDRYAKALHDQQEFLYLRGGKPGILPSDAVKIEHAIRPLAANQRGLDLAMEYGSRLQGGEEYTKLRTEGYERLKHDSAAFKVFEAQLKSDHDAFRVERTEKAEAASIPVQTLILQAEAKGGKMDPRTLLATKEYRALVSLGTPEATKLATALSDKVYTEHHAEVVEARAQVREARADARAEKADRREAISQERQSLYLAYSTDPDKLAAMSDFQFNDLALKLGPALGGKLLTDRKALTSPEKLAQAKVDSKTFNSLMSSMGVKDKAKQADLYVAAQDYIVAHQQEDKKVYRPDQMRQAILGAMQMVDVNERESFLGVNMGTTTTKKRRMEVKNTDAIVIPKADLQVVTSLLAKSGISDTPATRRRLYDAILAERGAKGVK